MSGGEYESGLLLLQLAEHWCGVSSHPGSEPEAIQARWYCSEWSQEASSCGEKNGSLGCHTSIHCDCTHTRTHTHTHTRAHTHTHTHTHMHTHTLTQLSSNGKKIRLFDVDAEEEEDEEDWSLCNWMSNSIMQVQSTRSSYIPIVIIINSIHVVSFHFHWCILLSDVPWSLFLSSLTTLYVIINWFLHRVQLISFLMHAHSGCQELSHSRFLQWPCIFLFSCPDPTQLTWGGSGYETSIFFSWSLQLSQGSFTWQLTIPNIATKEN